MHLDEEIGDFATLGPGDGTVRWMLCPGVVHTEEAQQAVLNVYWATKRTWRTWPHSRKDRHRFTDRSKVPLQEHLWERHRMEVLSIQEMTENWSQIEQLASATFLPDLKPKMLATIRLERPWFFLTAAASSYFSTKLSLPPGLSRIEVATIAVATLLERQNKNSSRKLTSRTSVLSIEESFLRFCNTLAEGDGIFRDAVLAQVALQKEQQGAVPSVLSEDWETIEEQWDYRRQRWQKKVKGVEKRRKKHHWYSFSLPVGPPADHGTPAVSVLEDRFSGRLPALLYILSGGLTKLTELREHPLTTSLHS